MKYRLSPREMPRAEPEGFPEGSGDISLYTPPLVTMQSFSITSTKEEARIRDGRCTGNWTSPLILSFSPVAKQDPMSWAGPG